MIFCIEDYEGHGSNEVCMLCRTEEEAENFCAVLNRNGKRWITGESYELSHFRTYSDEGGAAYYFLRGTIITSHMAGRRAALNPRTIILTYDDFDWNFHDEQRLNVDELY